MLIVYEFAWMRENDIANRNRRGSGLLKNFLQHLLHLINLLNEEEERLVINNHLGRSKSRILEKLADCF